MTIEEFRNIKQGLLEILNKWDLYFENKNKNNDNTFTEEDEKYQENIVREYLDLQNKLLSSDLSTIPFEEWKDITLLSETELDLSKTHANIDFSLLKEFSYETINLKGCKVRGLEYLDYKEDTFDEEFKRYNADYFPDKSLPIEIQNKFYDKKLEFKDLIDYPLLRKCVNKFSFKNNYGSTSNDFIKKIGFDNAIKLFDEYPEFIAKITDNEMYFAQFIRKNEFTNDTYENAKEYTFNLVIEYLKNNNNEQLRTIIPEEMQEKHPEAFLMPHEINSEFNEQIAYQFNNGFMTFKALREFRDVLKNKIIEVGTCTIKGIDTINKIYGNIWNFLDKVPENLEYEVADYLSDFYREEDIKKITTLSHDEIIKNAIIKDLNRMHFNYSLEKLSICLNYIPAKTIIEDEKLRSFIEFCGLKNLLEFNKKYNNILDNSRHTFPTIDNTLLASLSKYYKEEDKDKTINNSEDLYHYLQEIINRIKLKDEYVTYATHFGRELVHIFPKDFLDFETLDEILQGNPNKERIILKLNSGIEGLLTQIKEYPELINAFKDKDMFCLIHHIELSHLYYEIGNDKFFELAKKYGESLIYLANYDSFSEIEQELKNNFDNYEFILNKYYFEIINNNRTFDIRTLPESFKKEHPELYLHDDAPEDLKRIFYGSNTSILGGNNLLDLYTLSNHPDWIPHLMHIDLDKCLKEKKVTLYDDNNVMGQQMSIYKTLLLKFTQEETLRFLSLYGKELEHIYHIAINLSMTKEEIYGTLLKTIHTEIVKRNIAYTEEMPVEFRNKYPELFLDKSADENLRRLFYTKGIDDIAIKEHPEWIPFLKDKNLKAICHNSVIYLVTNMLNAEINNETILKIFSIYGKSLTTHNVNLSGLDWYTVNSEGFGINNDNVLEDLIKEELLKSILEKEKPYNEDLKPLLADNHPELFLSDDAPEDLKRYFYNDGFDYPLTYEVLKEHKEWMPFLKDKNVLLSMRKRGIGKKGLEEMFNYYGTDDAIKIGIKNPESVTRMLEADKFETLKKWYEKFHFIPHHVIMLEFPFEESDKFLSSGKKWSQLMKIEKYNLNEESKSALLKASMCFGVFDGDSKGFNQIIELFTGIPKVLTEEEFKKIEEYIHKELIFIPLPNDDNLTIEEKHQLVEKAMNKIKEKNLKKLNEVYNKKADGKYHFEASYQSDKEKIAFLKDVVEELKLESILTPDKAHKLFGGFIMKYDPDFRDFLLKNMETILASDEYIPYVSAMQKQWHDIKILNSNRKLTLDLALAFVKSNTYKNIQIGNEALAQVSNQAGYSQQDFDILQKIYDYGKARVFSSIPRIEVKQEEFSYEILRLDDPLALAIGTLSDCCQELGNIAEMCVEHSMIDKNGRVFVIRDLEGNIVTQSWVWRNKNVLCFDNIEIPEKVFTRAEKRGLSREEFAKAIYNIYEQAGNELIEKDEKIYKELLEQEKITQEQYESLKLAKVTVGIGYNDIKDAILNNAKKDEDKPLMPPEFTPKINLEHGLYTNDSRTQYIIAGEENAPISKDETLTVYQDEFKILDDSNITELDSLMLEKLEYITYPNDYYLNTQVDEKEKIVSQIAYNYNLNPETTRIIMNANFAIIYDNKENEIEIGDLFFNTTEIITENIVIMQIRMALEQIKEDNKTFNTSELNEKQLTIFEKAMSLDKEIDEERGIIHER